MAPARDAPGVANLRSISVRLSSTKATNLPHIVASQVQTIRDCGELLSVPRASNQSAGEAGIVVHRFYTQIAALIQGRTVEERWSAAVLIKATVEAGGYESLSKSKHWVAGLLSNLRKPDPPSTRALYITTLTRIFVLTWPYPSLVREITTPSLSPFIKTCLGNVTATNRDERELRIVLESFICLVSHHHTTFRTHVKDIGNVLKNEAGSADAQASISAKVVQRSTRDTAARLSTALHQCEPKQGYVSSWESEINSLVENSHRSLNAVLSGVEEDLDSGLSAAKAEVVKYFHTQPSDRRVAAIHTNSQTVVYTLEKLLHHILSDSTGPVTLKVHLVNSVIQRICTVVNSVSADGATVKFAVDVTRDERDVCVAVLPELHAAALQLLQGILARFPISTAHLAQSWMPLLRWVFQAEHPQLDVRLACYCTAQQILTVAGSTLSKEVTEQLYPIIKAACADLVGSLHSAVRTSHDGANASADGLLKQASKGDQRRVLLPAGLGVAASELLLAAQTHLPADNISADVRTQMDRTAILIQQKDAILASVLNPRVNQESSGEPSLLPFLVHAASSDDLLKAVLQPRVPVLHSREVSTPRQMYGDMIVDQNGLQTHPESPAALGAVTASQTPAQASTSMPAASSQLSEREVERAAAAQLTNSLKRSVDEVVSSATNDEKRQRTTIQESVVDQADPVAATGPELPSEAAIRSERDKPPGPDTTAEDVSVETTAIAMAPVPTPQDSGRIGAPNPVIDGGEDSDVEDFVIPDLDMGMSDEEDE
ncbi:hypothetical protein KVT40_008000 [Elsinoe batatas]|uniref:Pre-rRNA-processing protein RIX1 n=1 Tax=Elsinoe batatas TaxID=2601811 RepID=A0A8K0PEY4_9PEZI|nr:hypothetical protein KVT40_008000 [Elsinoe batatas]